MVGISFIIHVSCLGVSYFFSTVFVLRCIVLEFKV